MDGIGRAWQGGTQNWKDMANGPQVALSPVSPVSLVVVLTVPVRPPSVTCAVPVACSLPPRSGASGTRRSTLARSTQNRNLEDLRNRKN